MKVWVVELSDSVIVYGGDGVRVLGAFSTPEKAREAIDAFDGPYKEYEECYLVTEVELDAPLEDR